MENAHTSSLKENVHTNTDGNEQVPDQITVDPNLIQIRADSKELNRRIESFIGRKRQQANIVNIQEFCCHK